MNAWSIALDSIWHHKLRSSLTALGVVIGVFAVVTLSSLGHGVQSYITGQFSAIGAQLLTVIPAPPGSQQAVDSLPGGSGSAGGKGGGHQGGFGGRGGGLGQAPSTLTTADADALANAAHVVAVAPVASAAASVGLTAADAAPGVVAGTTAAYFTIEHLAFAAGDVTGGFSAGAVLGHDVAQQLFGDAAALGQTIAVNGRATPVVGVLRPQGQSLGANADDMVFLPVADVLALSGSSTVTQIMVQADSPQTATAAQAAVVAVLNARHPLKDFAVITAGQILSTINSTLSVITSVLGGIAAISLIVGGIGIMNIMLVTVTERVREIGTRKAMGARDGDILVQFLVESVLLALLGGAIGIALSALAGTVVGHVIHIALGVTLSAVGLALGFSLLVGACFGVLPAMNAARLMPAEALRSE